MKIPRQKLTGVALSTPDRGPKPTEAEPVELRSQAPTPSFVRSSGAAPGAGRPLDIRAQALSGIDPKSKVVTGQAFCKAAIAQIRKIKADDPNRRCRVVFDLDNTMFETRSRTLAALQAFDRESGTQYFAGLGYEDVGWDGEETCQRLGLPEDVTEAVHTRWMQIFWNGESFAHDVVMDSMRALAEEAERAGAEVVYLTGRVERLQPASVKRLESAGLPNPTAVFCKPSVAHRTGHFKGQQLEAWQSAGDFIGFFITDSRKEIGEVQGMLDESACVLFDHALDRPGRMRSDTPVWSDAP